MTPGTHKDRGPVVAIAIAECRHYLPVLACCGLVSLTLFVVSGLNIYR